MKSTRIRWLFASVVILMLADVAAVNASSAPAYGRGINFDVAKRATLRAAYYDSLRVCRIQQPGRASRRVQLSTTQFGVTQCLRRRGWTSDGTPLHDAHFGALPGYGIESIMASDGSLYTLPIGSEEVRVGRIAE